MKSLSIVKQTNTFSLSKNKNIINITNILVSYFIVFLVICIVVKPALCINSIYSGLCVWAKCVLPSLFPFMFFTKLLTNLNFISKLTNKLYRFNRFLFKAPKISSYVFLMSIISGYPIGAKLISDYYKMGFITKNDANKLSTFCSTSGPLFIIGSVGTAMLGSSKLGYILFFSHLFGTILNGIMYRNFFLNPKDKEEINNIKSNNNFGYTEISSNYYEEHYKIKNAMVVEKANDTQNMLAKSMNDSIFSALLVGGYIAIAFLVIDIFNSINLFYPLNFLLSKIGLPNNLITSVTNGIFEVSKGCLSLANITISKTIILPIYSFLIGFSGLCVFLQATTFLKDAKINLKFYLFQKFTHGLLSAIVCFLLCLIFKI